MVQGIIAGGQGALTRSAEGAEDSAEDGARAVGEKKVGPQDTVVGIAACGLTPFVRGAVAQARGMGAATVFVTCAPEAARTLEADVIVNPVVGPEVLTGSTRMKAGTATKLVLNTLTTAAMVRLGKVYGNLMVDLRASNEKLRDRAERIVCEVGGVRREEARDLLRRAQGRAKLAIAMHATGLPVGEAEKLLNETGGSLRRVIEGAGQDRRSPQSPA
jgi:N-acetylmuramic acid 6-phosphate etherase